MERDYVIKQARELVNGLNEPVNEFGDFEAQLPLFNYEAYLKGFDTYRRMAYPALAFIFFQNSDRLWSVNRIISEARENKLSLGEDETKAASAIKLMVADLEELNVVDFIEEDTLTSQEDREFRFRNDLKSLADVFEYISYLAEIYGADEQTKQRYTDLSQVFDDASLILDFY